MLSQENLVACFFFLQRTNDTVMRNIREMKEENEMSLRKMKEENEKNLNLQKALNVSLQLSITKKRIFRRSKRLSMTP
jgi:hypothetical protein